MFLIETHTHLDMEPFNEDRDSVVARAAEHGVRRIITIGIDRASSEKALELAHHYRNVYASVGIHPHDAAGATDADLEAIEELSRDPKAVAIGETGLDFFKNYSPHPDQERIFEAQLDIASRRGLPVIIHDRDAHDAVLQILDRRPCQPGVFHCFSGGPELARQVLNRGFHLSFTGNITFKNADKQRRALAEAGTDRLMLETDSPFMTPVPYRGKRCEPWHVKLVAEKAAEILNLDLETIARETTLNAYDLFGLERKSKEQRIAYELKGALYLNITNRCGNRCLWCARQSSYIIGPYLLRLEREPELDDILNALKEYAGDLSRFSEVVFCGFGEPLMRWQDIIQTVKLLRQMGAQRIRVNTNGWAELALGRKVLEYVAPYIDSVSVSLNAPDADGYQKLCNPEKGREAHAAVVEFIGRAKELLSEVNVTMVDYPGADVSGTRQLAQRLGVSLRVRSYVERP